MRKFILFSAITMLLGWGLRGYIGGGPFGAMIPGAMVALVLSMLLRLSAQSASILVVFSAVAIGLGGEMTYGQTLGLLRNPETVWWGTTGTTVKGAVWGLLGGILIALGLLHNQLSRKTIVVGYLLMMLGMLAGFKLINQPMLIYFSDPAKPRPESWAALLLGAIILFFYLKFKLINKDFRIVCRFALWGMIGGGLGFGLGSQWMVLGNVLPKDVIFVQWWKAMEFSFGLLFGAGLGLAAWLSRKEIEELKNKSSENISNVSSPVWHDALLVAALILVIFWIMPGFLDKIVEDGYTQGEFTMLNYIDLAKMLGNFAFYGFIMILTVLWLPYLSWQVGITLTFCYSAIDLMQDVYPNFSANPFTSYFVFVLLMNLIVGLFTAWFQRKENIIRNMFLLLVWACMVIAFIRLGLFEKNPLKPVQTVCEWICGRYWVHIVFSISAIWISGFAVQKIKNQMNTK